MRTIHVGTEREVESVGDWVCWNEVEEGLVNGLWGVIFEGGEDHRVK